MERCALDWVPAQFLTRQPGPGIARALPSRRPVIFSDGGEFMGFGLVRSGFAAFMAHHEMRRRRRVVAAWPI